MEQMIKFRGVSSSTHKKILIAIVAACVVFSLTSPDTVFDMTYNPLVKLMVLVGVMMMTYVSPILGGVLAACFVYCISTSGFIEGLDEKEKEEKEGMTEGIDSEDEDDEEVD